MIDGVKLRLLTYADGCRYGGSGLCSMNCLILTYSLSFQQQTSRNRGILVTAEILWNELPSTAILALIAIVLVAAITRSTTLAPHNSVPTPHDPIADLHGSP